MTDPFIVAAGPAPARNAESRWRQVALLSAASPSADDAESRATWRERFSALRAGAGPAATMNGSVTGKP